MISPTDLTFDAEGRGLQTFIKRYLNGKHERVRIVAAHDAPDASERSLCRFVYATTGDRFGQNVLPLDKLVAHLNLVGFTLDGAK